MTETLNVRLRRAEGALVRLLGLTERRGYPATQVSAIPLDGTTMLVQLTVRCERPLEQLTRQLAKLYDVTHVEKTP